MLKRPPFDETSWTNVRGEMSTYVRSKAIAERAAWDFMATESDTLELSVINPAGIFGPVLGADVSSSIALARRLMHGMPGCPRLYFGVADVRCGSRFKIGLVALARVLRHRRISS